MDRDQKRRKRRGIKFERHVRLHHWLLECHAYQALSLSGRALLIELYRLHNGENNGRIGLGVRDAAEALGTRSKSTAARAFLELQNLGFIVMNRPSNVHTKAAMNGHGRSVEWALTEFAHKNLDGEQVAASKAFMRWRPQKQNAVPPEGQTVPPEGHPTP